MRTDPPESVPGQWKFDQLITWWSQNGVTRSKPVTMRNVAVCSGVSLNAVSLALRNDPSIPPRHTGAHSYLRA